MPFYGLKFQRVIEYENGPVLENHIQIIQTDAPSVYTATNDLKRELSVFIDAWNGYKSGAAWKETDKLLRKLRQDRQRYIDEAKGDREFIPDNMVEAFQAEYQAKLATHDRRIANVVQEVERLKERARKELYKDTADGDYPEHRRIPGFYELTFNALFDSPTFNEHEKLSMPKFEIVSADDALEILVTRPSQRY